MRGWRCIGGRRINLKEIREMVEVGGRLTRAERGATCRGTEKTNVLPFAPRYQVGPCGTDSFHPPSLSLSRHHPPPLAPSRRRSLDAPQSYTTSNISNYILNTNNFFFRPGQMAPRTLVRPSSAAVVILLASLPSVLGFSFSYSAPTQCGALTLTWTGGTAPFSVLITPVRYMVYGARGRSAAES